MTASSSLYSPSCSNLVQEQWLRQSSKQIQSNRAVALLWPDSSPPYLGVTTMKFSSAKQVDFVLWDGEQAMASVPSARRPRKFPAWLEAVVTALVSNVFQPKEPVIRYALDGNQEIWRVYDPQTQREAVFSNETEVRIWLEQRYYH
nr:MAG: hypothetical protein EDM05_10305 [Leptolyngbya sp. IPPAS B-1204]